MVRLSVISLGWVFLKVWAASSRFLLFPERKFCIF